MDGEVGDPPQGRRARVILRPAGERGLMNHRDLPRAGVPQNRRGDLLPLAAAGVVAVRLHEHLRRGQAAVDHEDRHRSDLGDEVPPVAGVPGIRGDVRPEVPVVQVVVAQRRPEPPVRDVGLVGAQPHDGVVRRVLVVPEGDHPAVRVVCQHARRHRLRVGASIPDVADESDDRLGRVLGHRDRARRDVSAVGAEFRLGRRPWLAVELRLLLAGDDHVGQRVGPHALPG